MNANFSAWAIVAELFKKVIFLDFFKSESEKRDAI